MKKMYRVRYIFLLLFVAVLCPLSYAALEVSRVTSQEKVREEFNKSLFRAVQRDDVAFVRSAREKCLKLNKTLNIQHEDGYSLLHSAVYGGSIAMVNLILDSSSDVAHMINQRTRLDNTPLSTAVRCYVPHIRECCYVAVAEKLIEKRADVNFKGKNGINLLALAAKRESVPFLELLLKRGADPNVLTDGLSPLAEVTIRGNFDCVKVLLDAGAKIDICTDNGSNAFDQAAYYGREDILLYFLQHCVTRTSIKENFSVEDFECPDQYTKVVESLLKVGIDPRLFEEKGEHLAFQATRLGMKGLLKLCSAPNPHLRDQEGMTLLHRAVMKGDDHADMVSLLLDQGADHNSHIVKFAREPRPNASASAPRSTAQGGFGRVFCQVFLSCVPWCNWPSGHAHSPLVSSERSDKRPKLKTFYSSFDTPLILAARGGYVGLLWILLASGADPYRTNYKGETLLHCLVERGSIDTIKAVSNCMRRHNTEVEERVEEPLGWSLPRVLIAIVKGYLSCQVTSLLFLQDKEGYCPLLLAEKLFPASPLVIYLQELEREHAAER